MKRQIGFALLCTACVLQTSCAFLSSIIQKPNVTLRDVKLTDISLSGISANFIMGVDNPNPVGIDLASLGYQITVDGHQFAAGQANQALAVPANGSGQVTLPIGIKFADFIQSIDALFHKDTLPYSLATTLGFNSPIGTIEIPLATQGTFPVPKLPNVSMGAISLGNVDLSGATLNLGVYLVNPNAFPFPLGSLNYAVSVGGSPVVHNATVPQTLAPNGTQSVPLAVRLDFIKTGFGVMNAVKSGNATVGFDGTLDLGVYQYPVHLSQKLGN